MPLVSLARELGIAILVVHHERKQEAENSLDRVSGSTGLTAAADAIVTLTRAGSRWMLAGRGRDLEEFEWPMKLDNGVWRIEGEVNRLTPDQQRFVDELRRAGLPMSPKQLATALWQDEGWVRQTVRRLTTRGVIENPRALLAVYTIVTLSLRPLVKQKTMTVGSPLTHGSRCGRPSWNNPRHLSLCHFAIF